VARIQHQALPEELMVKEIFVTKGICQKRMRIMGRGRTGFGYKRSTHVTVRVEVIDFFKQMAQAATSSQREKWARRLDLVNELKTRITNTSL